MLSTIKRHFSKRLYNQHILNGTIFIHIPKTGGASLSKFIYGYEIGHIRTCQISNRKIDNIFTIIRDPYDIFCSALKFLYFDTRYEADQKLHDKLSTMEFDGATNYVLSSINHKSCHIHFQPLSYFIQGKYYERIRYINFSQFSAISEAVALPKENYYRDSVDNDVIVKRAELNQYLKNKKPFIVAHLEKHYQDFARMCATANEIKNEEAISLIRNLQRNALQG